MICTLVLMQFHRILSSFNRATSSILQPRGNFVSSVLYFSIITPWCNKWYILSETLNVLTFSRIYHVFSYTLHIRAAVRRMLLDNIIRITFPVNELSSDRFITVCSSLFISAASTHSGIANHHNLFNFFTRHPNRVSTIRSRDWFSWIYMHSCLFRCPKKKCF